jgi:hypothetical protein
VKQKVVWGSFVSLRFPSVFIGKTAQETALFPVSHF